MTVIKVADDKNVDEFDSQIFCFDCQRTVRRDRRRTN